MSGTLILSRDGGGRRHFLDGEPVRCGTTLEMLVQGSRPERWIAVRYEASLQQKCEAWLTPDGDTWIRVSDDVVLRWPNGGR